MDGEQALKELLSHRITLMGYILSIVADRHLAEDVFQELAVLLIHDGERLPEPESFRPWLRGVARNLALKALRARRRRGPLLDQATLDLVEGEWQRRESESPPDLLEALRRCMERLGRRARRLLDLRYGEGLACREVAERTRSPLNTVYVTLSRAQRSLAECVSRRRAQEGGARA